MPLTAETHIVSFNRTNCQRCGKAIRLPDCRKALLQGERIGVITASASGAVTAYLIGRNDSNPLCTASPLVARIERIAS